MASPAALWLGYVAGNFVYASGMASFAMLPLIWLLNPIAIALVVPRRTWVVSLLFHVAIVAAITWRQVVFYRAHNFRVREELFDHWGNHAFLLGGSLVVSLAAFGLARLIRKHRASSTGPSRPCELVSNSMAQKNTELKATRCFSERCSKHDQTD